MKTKIFLLISCGILPLALTAQTPPSGKTIAATLSATLSAAPQPPAKPNDTQP